MDDPWISDDGFWRWNGSQWVPNADEPIETNPPSPPRNVGDIVILPPQPQTLFDTIFAAMYYIFIPVNLFSWVLVFSLLLGTLVELTNWYLLFVWLLASILVYGYHKTSTPDERDIHSMKKRTGIQLSSILLAFSMLIVIIASRTPIGNLDVEDWIFIPLILLSFSFCGLKYGIYFPYIIQLDLFEKKNGQVPIFSIRYHRPEWLHGDDKTQKSLIDVGILFSWTVILVVYTSTENFCILLLAFPILSFLSQLKKDLERVSLE